MLSRAAVAVSRRAVSARTCATQAGNISPAGIDRENPLYAPSYRREWKHYGYTNIAEPDWKEWSDLPAPYKYYHVKVDPADVEAAEQSTLWKLFTNWTTAIPLSVGLAIPLFTYDFIVMDYHMELAAIFWTSVAMVYRNLGGTLRAAIMDENADIKKDLLKAEAGYFDALKENIDVHKKAVGLPEYVHMLAAGETDLKHLEAQAATSRMRAGEVDRMLDMLRYLANTSSGADADTDSTAIAAAQAETEAKLASDKALQQATIADAIAALKAGGAPQAGNTTEKVFMSALKQLRDAPIKEDPAVEQAKAAQELDIFNKRFGFVHKTVSADMMSKAASDPVAKALLTAKVGGAEPAEGAKLQTVNPMDFLRA
jgi:hypothetical protein